MERLVLSIALAACSAAPDDYVDPPSTYAEHVLALGPVGYWRLDETTGDTLHDASALGNDGGLHAAPRLGDPGIAGTSLHFAGNAQYADIPDRDQYSLVRAWDDFARDQRYVDTSWGGAWRGDGGRHYFTTRDGTAWIEPYGQAGTYEQRLPTTLAAGDLQLRAVGPIALVAGTVRAELDGTALRLADGDTVLATGALDPAPGFWYLRFQFDGTTLRARAWSAASEEPQAWLTASSTGGGAIAIRSTTSTRVMIQAFRAQSLGLTIHLAARLDRAQVADEVQLAGKGDHSGFTSATDQEYQLRYKRDAEGDHLKWYIFDRGGGYGAGVSFDGVVTERWYDIAAEFDPGDALDASAGVRMWVDGVALPAGAGTRYRSQPCSASHDVCWSIMPEPGDASLRLGTSDGTGFFAGNL
ncbi:MAG TPA: hypothetical protein VFQ65_08385, partial [Kofleriaceae bacterium]|nr:hypothetical protein [Kofleriaceae bacterium]